MRRKSSKLIQLGLATALALGLLPLAASAAPIPPQDFPSLVEKTLTGVVNVSSTTVINYRVHGMEDFLLFWGIPRERKQTSLGSGFLIDKEGFVLTNNHVVEQATEVMVTLYDKRQFKAKIVGKDQKMDLALLQIRDKERRIPDNLVPVALGNSETVRIAETVFAVGNPFGLQHTVTVGIISAKNRTIGQGPLFNSKGEVVGINTVIFSRSGQSGGVGFAIPVNEAKQLLPDLKKYGRVPRPWLGIMAERMTPQHQVYYQLPIDRGVLIYNIVEGGPADDAELRQGDIILSIDGTATEDPHEVERALAKRRPTDATKLSIRRGHRTLQVTVKLQELPRLENLPQGII